MIFANNDRILWNTKFYPVWEYMYGYFKLDFRRYQN